MYNLLLAIVCSDVALEALQANFHLGFGDIAIYILATMDEIPVCLQRKGKFRGDKLCLVCLWEKRLGCQ